MRMVIEFDMDNAAFEDEGMASESARILRQIAERLEEGVTDGNERQIRDINGNAIVQAETSPPTRMSAYIPLQPVNIADQFAVLIQQVA